MSMSASQTHRQAGMNTLATGESSMKTSIWNAINNPRSTYYIILIYLALSVLFSLCYWFIAPRIEGVQSLMYNMGGQSLVPVHGYFDAYYYSITTQTTVGHGDIVPATRGGKIVTALQVVVGYFYLAFTISFFTCKSLVQSETFKAFFRNYEDDIASR